MSWCAHAYIWNLVYDSFLNYMVHLSIFVQYLHSQHLFWRFYIVNIWQYKIILMEDKRCRVLL